MERGWSEEMERGARSESEHPADDDITSLRGVEGLEDRLEERHDGSMLARGGTPIHRRIVQFGTLVQVRRLKLPPKPRLRTDSLAALLEERQGERLRLQSATALPLPARPTVGWLRRT